MTSITVPPAIAMLQTPGANGMNNILTGLAGMMAAAGAREEGKEKDQLLNVIRSFTSVLINGVVECSGVSLEDFNDLLSKEAVRLDKKLVTIGFGNNPLDVLHKLADASCEWIDREIENNPGDKLLVANKEDEINLDPIEVTSAEPNEHAAVTVKMKTDGPDAIVFVIASVLKAGAASLMKDITPEKLYEGKAPLAATLNSCGDNLLQFMTYHGYTKEQVDELYKNAAYSMGGALKEAKAKAGVKDDEGNFFGEFEV